MQSLRGVLAVVVIGAAGCTNPSFVSAEGDGGVEAASSQDVFVKKPPVDAGRDSKSSANRDAAADTTHPVDAADDHGLDTSMPADAGHDAEAGVPPVLDAGHDGGHDSGSAQDAQHEAGPACATKVASDDVGVFVTPSGATTGTCGTRNMPCGSLSSALTVAVVGGHDVIYVAGGTYTASASIAIKDGISIVGGWTVTQSTWTGSCDPNDTPLFTAAATAVLTVGGSIASAGPVVLDTVNITNTSAGLTSAQSVYGLMAVGSATSSLALKDVVIHVPAASAGVAGDVGGIGSDGEGACPATANTVGTMGAVGTPGAGTYGPSGFTPATPNAIPASTGGMGGTPGSVIVYAPSWDDTGTPGDGVSSACGPLICDVKNNPHCHPVTCATTLSEQLSITTLSGCGGSGGMGGTNGGGGGSSIALYLWGETTTLRDGSLYADAAGIGGSGGSGGAGGQGAPTGATPDPVQYSTGCVEKTLPGGATSCDSAGMATLTGMSAFMGYSGGMGGTGAGGAGGDSYAYYAGNKSQVTLVGTPTFSAATTAASGGSPNGLGGYFGATNTSD